MSLSYEEQRQANILANQALLESLGLANAPKPQAKPKAKPKPKPKAVKRERSAYVKEATPSDSDSDSERAPSPKRRRSGRATRQTRRFDPGAARSDGETDSGEEYSYKPSKRVDEPQRRAQRLGIRTQDPKQYGHIPGVPVGTWWESRMDCSTAAVHGPPVAGIAGSAKEGAYSVALSGGYPDDLDLGEAFTYTGSGGRDLKGTASAPKNLRTAPQTTHQTFDNNFNASLKRSAETREPVRVIRGFKLDSKYAPREGYRYDGLYVVERAWMAKGLTKGLMVCRYAFRRLPGQPPLPERSEDDDDDEEEEQREEDDEEEVEEEEVEEEVAAVEESPSVSDEASGRVSRRTRTSSSTAVPDDKQDVKPKGARGGSKSAPKPGTRTPRPSRTSAKEPQETPDVKPAAKRARQSLPQVVVELPAPPRHPRRSLAA